MGAGENVSRLDCNHSPIDGVVLEKMTEPGELVTPQSFGGSCGPCTAVIAVADPQDLQVEIDVSEADLGKIYLGQRCQVSPRGVSRKALRRRSRRDFARGQPTEGHASDQDPDQATRPLFDS